MLIAYLTIRISSSMEHVRKMVDSMHFCDAKQVNAGDCQGYVENLTTVEQGTSTFFLYVLMSGLSSVGWKAWD